MYRSQPSGSGHRGMERRISDHDTNAARSLVRRFADTFHLPIYRSSYALILTAGANALLGLLFWIVAARLYPAGVVGLGAGGISALQLVAEIGWVGFQFTLLRYVPVAGVLRRKLVAVTYVSGIMLALPPAVLFTTAFAHRAHVPYIGGSVLTTCVFWVSVAVWVVFTLQDSVLLATRRTFVVPIENSVYGLIKLVMLVALSSFASPWTLLGVWVAGTILLVAAINALLFGRYLVTDPSPPRLPSRARIARFSTGQTVVAATFLLPDFVVPLIVLGFLSHSANAYYYAAWTVSFSSRLLATNIGNALTVEGAYEEGSVRALVRPVMRLCLTVVLPVMAVVLVGAPLILDVFGPHYAHAASGLLRWFALSLVPCTIVTLVIAYERVRERFGAALVIAGVGTTTAIGLDLILIPAVGIRGAGLGWLCGQTAAAIVAVVTVLQAGREARNTAATAL